MLCIKIQFIGAFCVALGFLLQLAACGWSQQHSIEFSMWFWTVHEVCRVGVLCMP